MKMKIKIEFLVFVLVFAIFSLYSASAIDPNCDYVGQKVYSDFYCDFNLDAIALKQIGISCNNDFECLNGSCLDGTCSIGYMGEIQSREGLLQDIVNLFKGKKVPAAGYKNIIYGTPAVFTAQDLNAPADAPVESIELSVKSDTSTRINYELINKAGATAAGVTQDPPGVLFNYIILSTSNKISDDIEYADINIKIPKSWISSNNIDNTKIKVYRWEDEWTELNVIKQGETSEYMSFKAKSPGFSVFSITAFALAPSAGASTAQASCSDGLLNQDETDVDCGGVCGACPEKCGDGINDNCENCPLHVTCAEGQICKSRQCINKPFPFWTVFIIGIAAAGLLFMGFKVISNSQKAKKREIERLGSTITYVINALNMKMAEKSIKDNLVKAGWNLRQISMAIKEAKKRIKHTKK